MESIDLALLISLISTKVGDFTVVKISFLKLGYLAQNCLWGWPKSTRLHHSLFFKQADR
jgi:hypothetical protein